MKLTSSKINYSFLRYKSTWFAIGIFVSIIAGTFANIFSYIALLLFLISTTVLQDEDVVCIFMFVMSFANIFKASPASQSFFTYLVIIFVLRYLLKKKTIRMKFFIAFALLIVFLALQMFFSVDILRTIKFVCNILFICFATNFEELKNTKKIFLFYILGMLLSSSVAALEIIPNLGDYIVLKDISYGYERTERFAGMYGDPNYYSVNLIISLCLLVILNHKKELSALSSIFLASVALSFVIMTVSKSAFVMVALPLILLLYSKVKKKNYFIFLTVGVLATLFVLELLEGKFELFDIILYRFNSGSDLDSLTTGRSSIWMNYMEYLIQNPIHMLFGGGFGSALLNNRAAHNTYIDMLYYLGLIGTILTAAAFLSMKKSNRKNLKSNLLNYSIWICIMIMYFFLSELFYFDWIFHFIIAILVSRISMNQVQEEI